MTNYMGVERLDKVGTPVRIGQRVAVAHENRIRVGVVVEIDIRSNPNRVKVFLSGDVLKWFDVVAVVVTKHQENLHE